MKKIKNDFEPKKNDIGKTNENNLGKINHKLSQRVEDRKKRSKSFPKSGEPPR